MVLQSDLVLYLLYCKGFLNVKDMGWNDTKMMYNQLILQNRKFVSVTLNSLIKIISKCPQYQSLPLRTSCEHFPSSSKLSLH
jgi:hypothetical protein